MVKPVKDSSLYLFDIIIIFLFLNTYLHKINKRCGLHQLPDMPESDDESASKKSKNKKKAQEKHKPLSLFEARRLKGWWPCIAEMEDGSREMAVYYYHL